MKLFFRYLRDRYAALLLVALCLGICAVVFALFRLPVSAVGYAALLCGAVAAVWLTVGFLRYLARHRRLTQLQCEIALTLEHLPEPKSLTDADYQALLRTLDGERRALEEDQQARYRDMMEYYTTWAHQIKTPIAAMRLILQDEDSDQSRLLGEELQRVEQYADMVLGYLRLDGDGNDFVLRRCGLDAIVRPAVRRYAGQFIRRKLKLTYDVPDCRVLTDEKWLRFVIEQVLSNALKYTRSGGVTITLEPERTLVIADTGIGIAPEDLPRVFERGFTGANGHADQRSSGIGLYLCRRIMTRLGHRITIESTPGKGTRVCLDLKEAELEVE